MAWAIVKNNEIKSIINSPRAITIDGIQHPETIFIYWTNEEKKAVGIYDFVEIDATPDNRFYWQGSETISIDNAKGIVTKQYGKTEKNLEDVLDENNIVTSKGVKTTAKETVKNMAAGMLQSSDWYVVRFAETGTPIPTEIAEYRAAVRSKSNEMETAINNATSIEDIIELYKNTDTTIGVLNDWPIIPDILKK